MNYSSIASNISSTLTDTIQTMKQIENIPMDDIWKGNAHNSLVTELKNIVTKLKKEQDNITKFSSVLILMETYKQLKEQLKKFVDEYNNQTDEKQKSELREKIEELEKNVHNLKNTILKELNFETVPQQESILPLDTITTTPTNDFKYSNLDTERILKDAVILPEPDPIKYIDGKPEGIFKTKAKQQVVYFDGNRLQEDSILNVKVGETIKIKVVLPKDSGEVKLLTRTSASGEEGWDDYIDGYSDPYVDRYNRQTAVSTDTFDWVITPTKKSRNPITISQTTFHTTDFSEEVKSMIRLKINIIDDEEQK